MVGAASGLGGLGSVGVGNNNATVTACDTNGITAGFTTVAGNVTTVTVDGLADPACEGGALRLTLADSANASLGSGGPTTIPTDAGVVDNSVPVTISPQPGATLVANLHVVIEGP